MRRHQFPFRQGLAARLLSFKSVQKNIKAELKFFMRLAYSKLIEQLIHRWKRAIGKIRLQLLHVVRFHPAGDPVDGEGFNKCNQLA